MSKPKIHKTDAEWRRELAPATYDIVRGGGTEPAFSGKYLNLKQAGQYLCAACGEELFSSETKYDSGSGWPSFSAPTGANRVSERADNSRGLVRTEVVCARCDAHLGHVFPDGPPDTGLRYCINSASLQFKAAKETG